MTTLNRIRHLLDAYYGGSASPAEVRELTDLLRNTPSLPAEFDTDRQIFESLDACAANTEASSPAPLEEMMTATITRCAAQSSRPRKRFLYWSLATGAAAAVILIISIFTYLPSSGPTSSNAAVYADATDVVPTKPSPSPAPSTPSTETSVTPTDNSEPLIASAPPAPKRKSSRKRHAVASLPADHQASSNLHVVTDPEEAAIYADRAFRLLADNLNQSAEVQRQTSATISNIKSEITNALISLNK